MQHESPTTRHEGPLPDVVVDHLSACVLLWVATAGDGGPNVAPKEVWTVDPGGIWVAMLASPVTAGNLRGGGEACVAAIDLWTQRGHKVGGPATIAAPPSDVASRLQELAGPRFTVRQALRVEAAWWSRIVAPSQRLGERDDRDVVADSLATHLASRIARSSPRYEP